MRDDLIEYLTGAVFAVCVVLFYVIISMIGA